MQDTLLWSSTAGTSIQTATPYASPYYYRVDAYNNYFNISTLSECYFRYRGRFLEMNSTYRIPCFRTGAADVAWLGTDDTLHFRASATTIGILETSTLVLVLNTWYLIEIYFKINNAPNGRFVVYVDGTKIIDYTGDTQPGAGTTFDNLYFGGSNQTRIHMDDFALNDTAGVVDNSWCGDGIVVKITPSGSGTVNNWANSGSVSGSANYLYVDEYPYDTTTYAYCSASSTGVKDKYAMSNLGGEIGNITRIFSEARIKKEMADSTTIKLGYLPDGGTDTMSGSIALYTTYTQAIGTSASANPVTGLVWTIADVNALEYIIEMS
jgi:hypothetical protein